MAKAGLQVWKSVVTGYLSILFTVPVKGYGDKKNISFDLVSCPVGIKNA